MDEELNGDLPECHEGPEAYERFDATMAALLTVPKSLILRRQRAQWRLTEKEAARQKRGKR